jgi:hypothetical protein
MGGLPQPYPDYAVNTVQSAGLLLANFHPHTHAVVPEGVFLETGEFVPLPDAQTSNAEEFWCERVFRLLLDEHKIDEATVGMMRGWKHSGFPDLRPGLRFTQQTPRCALKPTTRPPWRGSLAILHGVPSLWPV